MNKFHVTTTKTVTDVHALDAVDAETAQANYATGTLLSSTAGAASVANVDDLGVDVVIPIPPNVGDWRDPQGRIAVNPSTIVNPYILAVSGQSMPGNYAECDYFAPGAGVYEWNVGDGKVYPCSGWKVLGGTWWEGRMSILPYLATLLSAKYSRPVVIAALSVGGTTAQQWCPDVNAGGVYAARYVCLMQQLALVGWAPTKWWHVIGQQDAINGTTRENFAALTIWMVQQLRALGMSANFLMDLGAYQKYTPQAQIDAIRVGQVHAMQNAPGSCTLGVDQDQWPDDNGDSAPKCWRVDGVHPANLMRYYWSNAELAVM